MSHSNLPRVLYSAYAESYCHLFRLPSAKLRELMLFYKCASGSLQSRLDSLPSRAMRKISLYSVGLESFSGLDNNTNNSSTNNKNDYHQSTPPNASPTSGTVGVGVGVGKHPVAEHDNSVKHRMAPFPPPARASIAAIVAAR